MSTHKGSTLNAAELALKLGVSKNTAYRYLVELKNTGMLIKIDKWNYGIKRMISPASTKVTYTVESLAKIISEKLPTLNFAIWDFQSLAAFAHLVIDKNFVVVEASKYFVGTIRDVLIEENTHHYILRGRAKLDKIFDFIPKGGSRLKGPVIVVYSSEESGRRLTQSIKTATNEKMLVDIYYFITRKRLPLSAIEYGHILHNILNRHWINFSRFRRYAARRGLLTELDYLISRLMEEYPNLNIPYPYFGLINLLGTIDPKRRTYIENMIRAIR